MQKNTTSIPQSILPSFATSRFIASLDHDKLAEFASEHQHCPDCGQDTHLSYGIWLDRDNPVDLVWTCLNCHSNGSSWHATIALGILSPHDVVALIRELQNEAKGELEIVAIG